MQVDASWIATFVRCQYPAEPAEWQVRFRAFSMPSYLSFRASSSLKGGWVCRSWRPSPPQIGHANRANDLPQNAIPKHAQSQCRSCKEFVFSGGCLCGQNPIQQAFVEIKNHSSSLPASRNQDEWIEGVTDCVSLLVHRN